MNNTKKSVCGGGGVGRRGNLANNFDCFDKKKLQIKSSMKHDFRTCRSLLVTKAAYVFALVGLISLHEITFVREPFFGWRLLINVRRLKTNSTVTAHVHRTFEQCDSHELSMVCTTKNIPAEAEQSPGFGPPKSATIRLLTLKNPKYSAPLPSP